MRLTKHTIVAISGKQGSGKTTMATALVKLYSGTHMKFAGPLYEMHEAIRAVLAKYGIEMPKKVGELLQYLGTEFGRKLFGDDVWVRCIHNAILNATEQLDRWNDKAFIVVDDARFENELDMFLRLRDTCDDFTILTIRLDADEKTRKLRAEGWRDNVNHASETGLDLRLDDFDMRINTETASADEALFAVCQAIEDT